MFESLSKIANVKSYLREQTELYFRQIVEELDTTELYFNGEVVRISEIAVEPKVITNERVIDSLGISPQEVMDDDKRRFVTKGDVVADMQADFYERISQSETYKQISWSKALEKKNLRLAVKGEPGGGKSFMTKCTAIEIANESLRKLDSFETVIEDIEFPIWLTANDLAELRRQDSIEQILTNFVQGKNPRLSEKFLTRFGKQINNAGVAEMPKFFVFVDGLDELYDKNLDSFSIVSQKLYNFPARILIACRQFQWEAMQGFLKWNKFTEVALAPFKAPEQQKAIEKFFTRQPELKESLRKLADGNYALRNSFSSPLLLTFACLLHQTGELDEQTTHINLYELMVAKLFDGTYCPTDRKPSWTRRRKGDRVSLSDKTEILMALFDEIGWQLFQKHSASKEFSLLEWNTAFEEAKKVVEQSYPQIEEITGSLKKFRDELMKIRLLIMTSKHHGKQRWSYLHRTILEFTSARALATREDWLEKAKKHFWDSAWLEHLTFLAGEIEDVKPLIAAVKAEEDDIFGSMTLLEAKFTGVSSLGKTDIKLICDKIIYALQNQYAYQMLNRERPFKKIERPSESLGSTIYSKFLRASYLALNLNPHCRKYILETLFQPIIDVLRDKDTEQVIQPEVEPDPYALKFPTESEQLRQLAVDTLMQLGHASNEVTDGLIYAMQNNEYLCKMAAETLGELGNPSNAVITALTDAVQYDSSSAAISLVKLGKASNKTTEILIKTIQNDKNGYGGGRDAALTLMEFGGVSNEDLAILVNTLKTTDSDDQRSLIVGFLGELGDNSVEMIEVLTDFLFFEDYFRVRQYAAQGLGKVGNTSPKIIAMLDFIMKNDYEGWSCEAAANALGELGNTSEEAVSVLIEALRNNSESGRKVYVTPVTLAVLANETERSLQDSAILARKLAAITLVGFGHGSEQIKAEALSVLLDILQNEEDPFWVRESAAEALAVSGLTSDEITTVLIKSIKYDDINRVTESAAVALGKSGNISDEVVSVLIGAMRNDPFVSVKRDTASALSKICRANKGQDSIPTVSYIIRNICLQLDNDAYVLNSDFATPLFEIWRDFRSTYVDFKITREWLED